MRTILDLNSGLRQKLNERLEELCDHYSMGKLHFPMLYKPLKCATTAFTSSPNFRSRE